MSVQSQVERLSANVANTLSAIESKGVTVAETATSDDMAGLVGMIPAVALTAYEVTLLASGWESSAQSVTVSGVTADKTTCHVIVTPDPSAHDAYVECGVRCTEQAENALIFGATSDPGEDLVISVMVLK